MRWQRTPTIGSRISNPSRTFAVDKHWFPREMSAYKSFDRGHRRLRRSKDIVMGGSKGDDVACHAALIAELVSVRPIQIHRTRASSVPSPRSWAVTSHLLICNPPQLPSMWKPPINPILALIPAGSRKPQLGPTSRSSATTMSKSPTEMVVGPQSMSASRRLLERCIQAGCRETRGQWDI